jgi:hypothetical protein
MRSRLVLTGSALALTALVTGCGGSDAEDFCDSADTFLSSGEEQQTDLLEDMRDSAPEELRSDIDRVLEISRTIQSGSMPEEGALDEVIQASSNIQEYTQTNCG